MKTMKQLFIRYFSTLLLFASSLFAVGNNINYLNPFELAFDTPNTIIYGDYTSIASSVECIDNNGACDNTYNGYLFDATTKYIKDDATIPLNSSTETLSLPVDIDGADIIFAGLYWQGNITGDKENNYNTNFSNNNKNGGIIGRDKVTLKDAKGTPHNLTADKVWYHDFWGNGSGSGGGHRSFYQAYKNVTTILQDSYTKNTTNNYTVGNIKASAGQDYPTYFWADNTASFNNVKIGFWGNWQLIIVYQHSNIKTLTPQPKPKNVAIFHGFQPLIPLTPDTSKSIQINVSGFLTPKQAPINAKMLFYGSGGEKKLKYDILEIQDKKTANFTKISNVTNPIDGAYNGSISSFGVPIDPAISYYPGLDSDEFNVSNSMDTTQSTTILRLTAKNIGGVGDQFFPGVIAFSTDVYEPQFCYDYAYKQQNKFFTEDNNGTQNPRIVGTVATNEPITVSIYLKNLVASDVSVEGMELTVLDINTSQAKYVRDSTYLALNTSLKSSIADTAITAVSDAYVKGIPIGNLDTNDYFYTYYDINPSVEDINMTLNVNAAYNLKTSTANIPYNLNLSSEIPMCTTSSFQYTADKGEFNVVHKNYYDLDSGGTKKFYNLPTQVTNRVGNFKVISIDANDSLIVKSAIVGVETIDAAAFHSAYVSCQELASSISKKIWMIFDATDSVAFDKAALDAAYPNRTTLTPSSELYKYARENAAFRSSYPLDQNGSIQLLQKIGSDFKIKKFDYDQTQACVNGGGTIGSICGSDGAGNSSTMNEAALTTCMECIYGISTKLTCSRDNFAIRPDSFAITFSDTNQSTAPKQKLIDNLSATQKNINLAAAYKYMLDINATNFISATASSGYTQLYSLFNFKDTAQYIWSPNSTLLGCNDDTNKTLSFRIANGSINFTPQGVAQTGRYKFDITDTSWTTVDNNIDPYMKHHNQTYPNGDPMFKKTNGIIDLDCIPNSSITQAETNSSLNGCNISSEHNNSAGNLTTDIFTTFHPYKFDLANISAKVGLNNADVNATSYIYMSDMSQDENMSFHLNGSIKAVGYTGTTLSNFVDQCYAEPLTLDINKSVVSIPVAYQYRFHSLEINGSLIRTVSGDMNSSLSTISMVTQDFPKARNGEANTRLNLNFNRKVNSAQNPQKIDFKKYDVSCTTTANCSFYADLNITTLQGTKDINASIRHYFGRTHAKRQRFVGTTGTVFIYYETYCRTQGADVCDKALLQDGIDSNATDDPRWFINSKHTTSFGDAGTITQKTTGTPHVGATALSTTTPATATLTYDTNKGYPYKATMEINASSWLIYNPFNTNATTNGFEVEFTKSGSPWTGPAETNTKTKDTATTRTNRRTMW